MSVAKQRGLTTMPALKTEPVPGYAIHIWNAFMELVNCRPAKYAPISWVELKAYVELTETKLTPSDVNMLRAMDRQYLESIPKDNQG